MLSDWSSVLERLLGQAYDGAHGVGRQRRRRHRRTRTQGLKPRTSAALTGPACSGYSALPSDVSSVLAGPPLARVCGQVGGMGVDQSAFYPGYKYGPGAERIDTTRPFRVHASFMES